MPADPCTGRSAAQTFHWASIAAGRTGARVRKRRFASAGLVRLLPTDRPGSNRAGEGVANAIDCRAAKDPIRWLEKALLKSTGLAHKLVLDHDRGIVNGEDGYAAETVEEVFAQVRNAEATAEELLVDNG